MADSAAATTSAAAVDPAQAAKIAEREARKKEKAAEAAARAEQKKQKEAEKAAAVAAKAAAAVTADGADAADAKGKKKKTTAASDKPSDEEILKLVQATPAGSKKDLANIPMLDGYNPTIVESSWYSWWEKSGFFKPEYPTGKLNQNNPKGTFMICIPPPNVTGALHIGHALTNAVQDTLVRWHRMRGETTLWNPGTDHAGIATQVVVEKKLAKERKITRHELGREAFVAEVWKWKEQYGDRICTQLRRLGSSYDWDRNVFTMDPKLSNAVNEAFVQLHEKGYIYRSERLVNWSCSLKSAISDLEVEALELPGRTMLSVPGHGDRKYEFGVLVSFAYKIEGSGEEIVVATTRIETMLGDSAIAVHPQDERYKHLVGKRAVHPFRADTIPIIADDFVDRAFGTGAVKITPAHDHNDYEVGKRHSLPFLTMLNDDGTIDGRVAPKFGGMKRFDARNAVMAELKTLGLFKEVKDNPMSVPICQRSKDVVEPLIKPQWFCNCDDMAKRSVAAVKNGDLRILPAVHEKTWYHWLDNIRDWCISRQLWWGHRIPAYYVRTAGETPDNHQFGSDSTRWFVGRTPEAAREIAAAKLGVAADSLTLEQDPDVLDTWFSSALFPFSIFGWPNGGADFETFFPGSLLETGADILFFWVARMVFFSLALTDKLPFKDVYLHPIVRDAQGRKMSKTLGNVIDPVDVIQGISLQGLNDSLAGGNLDPKEYERALKNQKEVYPQGIPECGTDALRFALLSYLTAGRDINLDVTRVTVYRFFCNKLWNATKFAMANLGKDFVPAATESHLTADSGESKIDQWILSRLANAIEQANNGMRNYDFPLLTSSIHGFWLYELCDVYLEAIKPVFRLEEAANGTASASTSTAPAMSEDEKIAARKAARAARDTLYTCLDTGLRLLSPIMPFVTEELYQRLPRRASESIVSICVAAYPESTSYRNAALEADFSSALELLRVIRSLKTAYLPVKAKADVYVVSTNDAFKAAADQYRAVIANLSASSSLTIVAKSEGFAVPEGCAMETLSGSGEVHLMVKGLVDAQKELDRFNERLKTTKQSLDKLLKLVAASDYEQKVPENIRQTNDERIKTAQADIVTIERGIAMYEKMRV
ncbi:valyl-tRNA synthetase [Capsaspora owczarzaki ATCC 30864]|uniref:Valine--tRNA ligase, mitochondrial n=1 Tax=Capsaspora owczarzaki (strain ATCC 30864) TaxID=595528 RepID=A0A0D2WQR3_CAPO3|nr:valyl-tRNA synthetase [Capsaspora owczarzaki ATCC 30864]KJE93368.1 valyl-tRNA synthetase [Capsaspora owczarzaki ATCC 30864]|eukprot:XP_004347992.1 valyl-tRNA synthetase [Capsaspora owczarzaki ATCC 30864]